MGFDFKTPFSESLYFPLFAKVFLEAETNSTWQKEG